MLRSLTSPFKRERPETASTRPSGAYRQGPSGRPTASSGMRSKRPTAPKQPLSVNEHRELLRESLQHSLTERRYHDALNHILGLISLDPSDPRWPHKYGDVLRSLRRNTEAAAAYRRAARRYEAAGFPVRANAMLRLSEELDGAVSRRAESGPVRRADVTVPVTEDQVKPHIKAS